jgi:hypothetical protein
VTKRNKADGQCTEKCKISILIDETQSEKSMLRDSMNEVRKIINY